MCVRQMELGLGLSIGDAWDAATHYHDRSGYALKEGRRIYLRKVN